MHDRLVRGVFLLLCLSIHGAAADLPRVVFHDNDHPSGRLRGTTLSLDLDVVEAMWHPDGPDAPGLVVPVFAERGQPPVDPGPLIRVTEGATIELRVRNRLPSATVTLHGLHTRPGKDEPTAVPSGEERRIRFTAGTPGAYFYWASTEGKSLQERQGMDGQLSGALIVDGASGPDALPVFLISHYDRPPAPKADPPVTEIEVWTINGRAWPNTRRLTATVGEPVRWLWINASYEPHPLHLHGTYFTIDTLGDNESDRVIPPTERRSVVTESLAEGGSMRITWTPLHPGNWLFHCHIIFHVDPYLSIAAQLAYPRYEDFLASHDHSHNHMSGLVIGVTAKPRPGSPVGERPPARKLTLVAAPRGAGSAEVGYQLFDGDVEPAAELVHTTAPGAPIVLTRDQPVDIKVLNRLRKPTTVHWHGMELESYFDGVSGWGGAGSEVTPLIPPGGSFVARFCPPRSGTFIYHTHLNDFEQLTGGLYGALLVIDDAKAYDPARDLVFVYGRDGIDENAPLLVNGSVDAPALRLQVGKRYRLRFIGITPAEHVAVSLKRGDAPVSWRPMSKDGALLPASLATSRPAAIALDPGETYDFEFIPESGGSLLLGASIVQGKFVAKVPLEVVP